MSSRRLFTTSTSTEDGTNHRPGMTAWSRAMAVAKGRRLEGRLYVVGGYLDPWEPSRRAFAFEPAANAWHEVARMPTARGALGAAGLDGKLYAVGGEANGNVPANEVYDPATDSWTRLAALP